MSTTGPLTASTMQARNAPASRAAVLSGVLLAGAGGTWLLHRFDPNSAGSMFPPCLFHFATGLYCPGCGITRALHALAHGDVVRAWSMNPLVLVALPALALVLWQWGTQRTLLPVEINRRLHDGVWWIVALLVFGVLRNLPWPAFAWMAPG